MRFSASFWKGTFALAVLFFLAYAATRLLNLTALPIFTDEAIYIRWSQIGAQDANWRFISLTDGKQPMFTWVMMLLLRFMPSDPLFTGRLTSVLAGLGTMIGLWFLSYELFRKPNVSWLVTLVYVISPFTLWYDRMAIYDSMVSLFSVWSLYLATMLARSVRLDIALLLGMVLGMGMLNKSSGFLSLYMLPVTILLFDWKKDERMVRLLRWIAYVAIAAVMSQIIYSILRLSPFFYIVGQKDNVFIFSPAEWLAQPFRFFAGNLRGMSDWLRSYMTLPLFALAFLPFFIRSSRWPERLVLYAWSLAPFFVLANFGKVLYPRFILFMTIPLFIVAAESLSRIFDRVKKPFLAWAIVLLLLIPSLYTSYFIIRDPLHAPITLSDRAQYIDDWPSGWGVPQVVSYIGAQAAQHKVNVFTDGTFGLLPYALEIYYADNPNVHIVGIWPLPEVIPEAMVQAAKEAPTYLILNQAQSVPVDWPHLELVGKYQKGMRADRYLRLLRVTATPNLPAL